MNKIKPIHMPSNTQNHSNSNSYYIPDTEEGKDDGFSHYRKVKASLAENSILNSFLCNPKISNKAKAAMIKKEVQKNV